MRSPASGSIGDEVLEGLPFEQLHDQIRLPLVLADVMNRADVGMVERRGRLGLASKPLQRLRIVGELFRQELQRHRSPQPGVFGLVDDTHAAATELRHDLVVRNRRTDHLVTMDEVYRTGAGRSAQPHLNARVGSSNEAE